MCQCLLPMSGLQNELKLRPLQLTCWFVCVFRRSLYYDSLEGTNQQPKHHRRDYISHVHHVTTMTTAEEFWSAYNHILSPAELANSSNCHFFKVRIMVVCTSILYALLQYGIVV